MALADLQNQPEEVLLVMTEKRNHLRVKALVNPEVDHVAVALAEKSQEVVVLVQPEMALVEEALANPLLLKVKMANLKAKRVTKTLVAELPKVVVSVHAKKTQVEAALVIPLLLEMKVANLEADHVAVVLARAKVLPEVVISLVKDAAIL